MIIKEEIPLGGGEGSVVYFLFRVGPAQIHVATSRSIVGSPLQRHWVPALAFLDDFKTKEDIEETLRECEDNRFVQFIYDELGGFLNES